MMSVEFMEMRWFLEDQEKDVLLEMIADKPSYLRYIANPTEDMCLASVRKEI